jgi:shikimate kinase
MNKKMNLFIIGYRCTGKSTVAKVVSEKTGWTCVDADSELADQRGETVAQIVATGGWPLFRKLEKETLKKICSREGQVVATGGGVVLDEENIELMRKSGEVIWLRANAETIIERMQADEKTETLRPALTEQTLAEEIKQTLSERVPLYQKAMTWSVDTDGKEVMDVITEIISHLKNHDDLRAEDS